LRGKYYIKKGGSVEDVVAAIIEQHCEALNIPTTRQKYFNHPDLGGAKVDLYCEGLEGKRVAVDVTTARSKTNIIVKWTEKRYQDYPGVDELWVVVCSNAWDSRACAELTKEAHRNSRYRNVHVYNWKDLLDIKMMTIPPKIWKLLEVYEMCTLENKEECRKYWEEAKERFHTF
jgi:rhodanese-related sulfurtransferase